MADDAREPVNPEEHRALYRRYRSRRFGELVGQDHVVTALRNAVGDGRAGHAYLFSGPRGTGKTSTARILAKALNCTALAAGEPCCVCESCRSIEAGTSYDLHELDAASNNGVDAMRDLISKAALGSPGRTKVYILDEVHMLSTAASNALLKTLEEPPAHVTFVLATTDPQKVLPTIRSRTQHFEFRLISADELERHVRWIMADAGISLDDEAIRQVVRRGAGSARDTLSVLDQVVALGGTSTDNDVGEDLLAALASRDTAGAITAVARAVSSGREPRIVGEALLGRLRDAFLITVGHSAEQLPEAERAAARDYGRALGLPALTRAMECIGEALLEMRQAPDPRVALEVALVRLTRPELDTTLAALLERVARLEETLRSGNVTASAPIAAPNAGPAPTAIPQAQPGQPPGAPPASRPGGLGPAAEARRRIQQAKEAAAPPPRAEGPPPLTGSTSANPQPGTAPSPEPQPPPLGAASDVAASDVADPGDPPVPAGAPTGPTLEQVIAAWESGLFETLSSAARARYRVGRFVQMDGGVAVFGLPNPIHRDRCEEIRGEVEDTLSRKLGTALSLRLVVDGGGSPAQLDAGGGSGGGGRSANAGSGGSQRPRGGDPGPPEPYDEPGFDDIGDDVHALEDASDTASGSVDLVQRHFPGAFLVE